MSKPSSNVLRFNGCELDLDRRQLRRDGELVSLEPRVFALLVYLINQHHRAVDKDEIQDAVWTGVIVTETALTRATELEPFNPSHWILLGELES